jgi:hypothetical protein
VLNSKREVQIYGVQTIGHGEEKSWMTEYGVTHFFIDKTISKVIKV